MNSVYHDIVETMRELIDPPFLHPFVFVGGPFDAAGVFLEFGFCGGTVGEDMGCVISTPSRVDSACSFSDPWMASPREALGETFGNVW